MDGSYVISVLRSWWSFYGWSWGNSSYPWFNHSVNCDMLSSFTQSVLKKCGTTESIRVSDILSHLPDPSRKLPVSSKFSKMSKRNVHVLIIEVITVYYDVTCVSKAAVGPPGEGAGATSEVPLVLPTHPKLPTGLQQQGCGGAARRGCRDWWGPPARGRIQGPPTSSLIHSHTYLFGL
jgi:hypothetical protein